MQQIKEVGYKVFQIFEGEGIKAEKLAEYIKEELALGNYKQIGKQKKHLSANAKKKRHTAILERQQKIKEEQLAAEAREQALKERAIREQNNPKKFDPYDTNFDFEAYEIK